MKIENINEVELIIKEIKALESFIEQLPGNETTSDQIFFGNNETGAAELKVVFKGENLKHYIKDLKVLVFKNAQNRLKDMKESLKDL